MTTPTGAADERERICRVCRCALTEDAVDICELCDCKEQLAAQSVELERVRKDAERYRFLRQRIRIRKEDAMSGSKRDVFDFRIGLSFVDSKQVPGAGFLDPQRFIAECVRVDDAIDAALAAAGGEKEG